MPKPVHKKKPFIDKKNAIRFQLVHRSQKDPLAADADAPQTVLKQIEREKFKKEEQEYGVFFDDDYNYLQHLKVVSEDAEDGAEMERFIIQATEDKGKSKKKIGNLSLPSNIFATEGIEEEVGLLNKAAPRGLDLSLDPDVVAAMDDDFDFDNEENELEDDFVMQLMGDGSKLKEGDEDEDGESGEDEEWMTDEEEGSDDDSDFMGGRSEDEEGDEVPELYAFDEEETKTKFTNYSMSSSVIRRNKELSTLDDKFEKFMDQYGELDEGALDGEDIEGFEDEDGERMQQLLAEADQDRKTRRQAYLKEKEMMKRLAIVQEDKELTETVPLEFEDPDPESRWDAESILSTYSNKYNHPKLISERKPRDIIELSSKTGIPKNTLGRGLTAAALKQLDLENCDIEEDDLRSIASRVSEISIRNKHETIEEKRARKLAVKEFRRERRIERKANTKAFKDEKLRQEKILQNNKNNLQGNRIL